MAFAPRPSATTLVRLGHPLGQTLYLPDAPALAAVAAEQRFVCLSVLLAARDGAAVLRFEQRQGAWVTFARRDAAWVLYPRVAEAADIPRGLKDLTSAPGVRGWASRLFRAGRFCLRLGEEEVACRVSADGPWAYMLSLRPTRDAAAAARELLGDYWELPGDRGPPPSDGAPAEE